MTSNDWFALIPLATLFTAVSGIISVLVSALIAEFIRRRNRADAYASIVFTKRIEAYEKFYNLLNQQVVSIHVFSGKLSAPAEVKEAVNAAVYDFINFSGNHAFFVNDDIAMAAVALNMGLEDYPSMSEADKKKYQDRYYKDRKNLLHMIKQDSGIAKINQIFKAAYDPKYHSEFIDMLNEKRAEYRQAEQAKLH
ncbi:hypothetical protein [Rhizobium phaseoli]|uniref:DUF4760 domain-containing protein n=1 Tax=Rhizobium phaseoli TaxID=396 RepID=A0ABM6CFJ2_9HYPH|nr:hypothetical protein [Rhizobium phaseoli]ANL87034.1 hypothetical protein AMC81_PA00010 [Rhizobium phaseoli]ANL93543.1 hypothetical protein AMC80_PA00010 [Rhizobium phaseoli]